MSQEDGVLPPRLRAQAEITEQLGLIQSKRRALEDAILSLDAEEVTLRRAWNSLLPVNHLPNELLVKIFEFDAGAIEPMSCLLTYMEWVRLMLVCTYWREVACATPTLWSVFATVGSVTDCLDLFLTRAGTTPLRIHLSMPAPGMLQTVTACSQRIQALSLHLLPSTSLIDLVQRSMPVLEELVVTGADKSTRMQMSPTDYPALRSLALYHVTMPSDIDVYAGLRRLSLSNCGLTLTADRVQMSLLDVLRVATRLESLSIFRILRWYPHLMAVGAPPIILRNLSDFSLLGELPEDARNFVGSLRFPPHCCVKICAGPDHVLEEWEDGVTMEDLLPDNRTDVLPMLTSATAVELVMNKSDFTLRGSSADVSGEHWGVVQLSVTSPAPSRWEIFLESGLLEIVKLYRGAPVKHLRVTGDHRSEAYLHGPWCSVLESFPTLETIELSGWGSGTPLWTALDSASPWRPSKGPAACPKLRAVVIDGKDMLTSATFFNAMLNTLRRRVKRAPRLETLRLKLRPEQSDLEGLMDRYLSQVRELVGNVSYELYA